MNGLVSQVPNISCRASHSAFVTLRSQSAFICTQSTAVDPVGLLCPFTMVSFGADYRLRLDDIPELQILMTYGHFPRTTLHSISIATASAKFPAEFPPYPSPIAVGISAIIPGNGNARTARKIRDSGDHSRRRPGYGLPRPGQWVRGRGGPESRGQPGLETGPPQHRQGLRRPGGRGRPHCQYLAA